MIKKSNILLSLVFGISLYGAEQEQASPTQNLIQDFLNFGMRAAADASPGSSGAREVSSFNLKAPNSNGSRNSKGYEGDSECPSASSDYKVGEGLSLSPEFENAFAGCSLGEASKENYRKRGCNLFPELLKEPSASDYLQARAVSPATAATFVVATAALVMPDQATSLKRPRDDNGEYNKKRCPGSMYQPPYQSFTGNAEKIRHAGQYGHLVVPVAGVYFPVDQQGASSASILRRKKFTAKFPKKEVVSAAIVTSSIGK
jgi:hypothetical protein